MISQSALGVISGYSDNVMHGGEVGSGVSLMHARSVWSSGSMVRGLSGD